MALISLQDVSISFGGPLVLDQVTLHIEQGERVCLLGRNGEGKSTLLQLVSGALVPDHGEVLRQQGLRVGYLPQTVPQEMSGTVLDMVMGQAMEGAPETDEAIWERRQHAERVVTQLQLAPDVPCEQLSGGLKRRVLLGRAMACQPDLLLLDEPTNHLDIDSITWLEAFLLRQHTTLLFVTHDRMLLRRLATRIIELDRGHLADWACDYDTFLQRKEAMLEAEANQWTQFEKKLAQEESWIRQGIRARRTRNEGRVRALQRMREQWQQRRVQASDVRMQAQTTERSGHLVIEAENVTFGYDEEPVVRDLSTLILRGDKIGIIGPNGAGKTTLLRLLLKEIEPQQGHIRLGSRLQVTYFDQLREQIDDSKTVQENVGQGREMLDLHGKSRHILSYLQDFLFTPERARSPASLLSGGERNRLLLARLFTQPANVLVLDEPTNDLDAETLELLEELLHEFEGTVLLVSHDRTFLNNVVTSTLVFESAGRVREYVGGYDDWLRQRQVPAPSKPAKTVPKRDKAPATSERPRRMNNKERFELEAMPERIEALEAEQEQLYAQMSDPDFYRRDGDDVARVKARIDAIAQELEAAYKRWEMLEQLR
jgi:ATP-binding cassette subfamily F protein uup